jgi:hypothetical protein
MGQSKMLIAKKIKLKKIEPWGSHKLESILTNFSNKEACKNVFSDLSLI